MTANEILDMLYGTLHTTGIYNFQWNIIVMWGVGCLFYRQFPPCSVDGAFPWPPPAPADTLPLWS